MSNQWLRLWHDMPNDPKWRTIARVSKQPVSAVIAVYVHVLVAASNAPERGRTQSLNSEDIASAIDVETPQVEAILSAMQGRVLDGDKVAGWDKRQPQREDGSAERAKAWREGKKNAGERTPNAEKRPDTDTDTDKREDQKRKQPPAAPVARVETSKVPDAPDWVQPEAWSGFVAMRKRERHPLTPRAAALVIAELERLRAAGDDPSAVLDQSTRNGWRDVYAIKPNNTGSPRGNPARPSVAADFRQTRYEGTPDEQLPASLRPV